MRLPFTLSFYMIRQFVAGVAVVFCTFSALIILIDALELVRRSYNRDVPAIIIIEMTLLKFPLMMQRIIPFIILIGAVLAYTKLSHRHELVVARAAGISVWQFLFPSVITAFLLGILMITILNPLFCAMLLKYENMEGKYMHGRKNFLSISQSGLWLRQKNIPYGEFSSEEKKYGETIIHARDVGGNENIELYDVIVFVYQSDEKFSKRIDAKHAELLKGFWHLKDVIITFPDGSSKSHDEYFLETDMNLKDIQNSFSSPETISFWELPSFINTLEKSGFSARSHRLHWHTTLASPIFYSAMIFIAAIFSLSSSRQAHISLLITSSVVTGFFIYFINNLILSLGLSGSIPIALAAWSPVGASLLVGIGLLLHFEDG